MKIRNLLLATKDVQRLSFFYRDVLGLSTVLTKNNLSVTVGDTIIQFKQSSPTEDPFYHFAINIPCNKIEEAKDWLSKKLELIWMDDYRSVIADFINWRAKSVYFFDVAGNIVELIARFDLKNETADDFNVEHFLSVSEIGIVFPDHEIENKTAGLLGTHLLNYFDKQPPFPNFKAVGDDDGLFIIVTKDRNWYPTNKPSGIFPIEISFEQQGKNHYLKF